MTALASSRRPSVDRRRKAPSIDGGVARKKRKEKTRPQVGRADHQTKRNGRANLGSELGQFLAALLQRLALLLLLNFRILGVAVLELQRRIPPEAAVELVAVLVAGPVASVVCSEITELLTIGVEF
jgi:hypothetical protein